MGQIQSHEYNCNDSEDKKENKLDIRPNSNKKPLPSKKANRELEQKCPNTLANLKDAREHVRKLSSVSNRNIQLLSMKPRSEKDSYADNLRNRRKSSLINLILGAPSSGPRFSDDLWSLNSRLSDCNFGIEFFSDAAYNTSTSVASLRIESLEDLERGLDPKAIKVNHKHCRSSVDGIEIQQNNDQIETGEKQAKLKQDESPEGKKVLGPSIYAQQAKQHFKGGNSIASTLASIDLTSSFEQHDNKTRHILAKTLYRSPFQLTRQATVESLGQEVAKVDLKARLASGRVNQTGRVLRRTGSELSLYSTGSATSNNSQRQARDTAGLPRSIDPLRETKLIIMMQVCLPFILAGFGNMSAGLILNDVAEWKSFKRIPIFFILLPPFIGLKGNIEMTLASRLSTLSNLNLLETGQQKRRAYTTNLVLVMSQAIGLSLFASLLSIFCEALIGGGKINLSLGSFLEMSICVVLASAFATALVLVLVSSIIMWLAVGLARIIKVNPDNLSTLLAALYGDVSCVITYSITANWMFELHEQRALMWPSIIIISTLIAWPILIYLSRVFEETRSISLSSIPPMVTSIIVSMGSGAILSLVVDRFHLIALYQPVVNGFGANLIAVQASRVSTWLWCVALRKISTSPENPPLDCKKTLSSVVAFSENYIHSQEMKPPRPHLGKVIKKLIKTLLWSFWNSTPNSMAARLLLVMMIPAHTLYFFVIWLLSPANQVTLTWQFYSGYIGLCLLQVFVLLAICEPLMTIIMNWKLDPDIFGISLLMALADLMGTLCLAVAFYVLAWIGDPNASTTSLSVELFNKTLEHSGSF